MTTMELADPAVEMLEQAAREIGIIAQGYTLENVKRELVGTAVIFANGTKRYVFADDIGVLLHVTNRALCEGARLIGPNRTTKVNDELVLFREMEVDDE